MDVTILSNKTSASLSFYDTKKISGKLNLSFEILRNKKPEISTTSGSDISLYCYSMSVLNHEALPP